MGIKGLRFESTTLNKEAGMVTRKPCKTLGSGNEQWTEVRRFSVLPGHGEHSDHGYLAHQIPQRFPAASLRLAAKRPF